MFSGPAFSFLISVASAFSCLLEALALASREGLSEEKLGSGKNLDEALEEMHMVAEGVSATRMFLSRSKKMSHPTPFLSTLGSLLDGEIEVEIAVRKMVE